MQATDRDTAGAGDSGRVGFNIIDAIEHPQGEVPANWDQFKGNFFAGNEARFLKLDQLATDSRLTKKVRSRLAKIVNRLPAGWNTR